jgi:hypothetical protein
MGFMTSAPGRIIAIAIPAGLLWLAFIHTDENNLTAWEHTKDVFAEDDWIGWIHPFGQQGRVLPIGPFDSVEQCQNYAFDHLQRQYDAWDTAEYYCGYKCISDDHRMRDANCEVVRK